MELESTNVEVPRDLIAESPEAQKFVQDAISNLDEFKLYPGEEFLTVVGNVVSGTGLDRQGESASVADLEALVSTVDEGAFFLRREHDPLIHPIGRIVAAKMFQLPQTEKYFVVGIIGFYDASKLPSFASKGIDVSNLPYRDASLTGTPEESRALVEFNPYEIPPSAVEEMLETAPASVGLGEGIHSRKGVISLAILQISASIWLLSRTPFGTKFQERLGEKAADASVAFLKWISETVSGKLRELTGKETRLVISFRYKDCTVEFVLTGKEGPAATTEAIAALENAANQSLLLVEALQPAIPIRLTYGYNVPAKRWFPIHATTRRQGIITDQPYLIAVENLQGGFSVGGRRLPLIEKGRRS
jgi:hypothetical protein